MTTEEIVKAAHEAGFGSSEIFKRLAEFRRLIESAAAAERQRIEATGTSLYELTGDIADINTLLIQRNEIRARGEK